jgi:hypothetical protein
MHLYHACSYAVVAEWQCNNPAGYTLLQHEGDHSSVGYEVRLLFFQLL